MSDTGTTLDPREMAHDLCHTGELSMLYRRAMADTLLAQREQIAALEKRVKAADAMQLDAQMMARMIADSLKTTVMQNVAICPDESRTLNDAFKTIAAYRATGGQDNE